MNLDSSTATPPLAGDEKRKRQRKRNRDYQPDDCDESSKRVTEEAVTGTGFKHLEPGDYAKFFIDSLIAHDNAIAAATSSITANVLARRKMAIQNAHLSHGYILARKNQAQQSPSETK